MRVHMRLAHPVWLVVLALMGTRKCTAEVDATQLDDCWVFHRMPKAGSMTVQRILRAWIDQNNVPRGSFSHAVWADPAKAGKVRDEHPTVVSGGYSEALRALGGGQRCKWFTMFRHPVSRLVSAYYFCKYKWPNDQACGKGAIDLETTDIYAFAEFWSNYAMRQYIMAFFTPEQIMTSPAVQAVEESFPGWYKVGLFVNELFANETAEADAGTTNVMYDKAMERFLEPAMEILNTYAAVALLEDFENGLRLFEESLGIPELTWLEDFKAQGMKNEGVEEKSAEHEETLKSAMTDPDIRKFLSLDILLYDHAVALYSKQLVEYGLA